MPENIEFRQRAEFLPEPETSPTHEGPGAARSAAAELRKRRGEGEAPTHKVVMGEDAPKSLSLRQAAKGLAFSRDLANG